MFKEAFLTFQNIAYVNMLNVVNVGNVINFQRSKSLFNKDKLLWKY